MSFPTITLSYKGNITMFYKTIIMQYTKKVHMLNLTYRFYQICIIIKVTLFMPVLVLIAHVISSVHITCYGCWKQSLLK